MDLEQKLQEFQQKYINLEQQATPGSLERHVYSRIVTYINNNQNATPELNHAFEIQFSLVTLAETLDPPRGRPIVWKAIRELEQIADIVPRS